MGMMASQWELSTGLIKSIREMYAFESHLQCRCVSNYGEKGGRVPSKSPDGRQVAESLQRLTW